MVLGQGAEVSGEGGGVTGDVADFWDFGLDEGVEEVWVSAFSGRVEDG